MDWNVLIVDDEHEQGATTQEVVASPRTIKMLGDDATINTVLVSDFDQAFKLIQYTRFDLIILDLRDENVDQNGPDAELSGERVLAQLRTRQFTPVIFYTGYPQKVEHQKGAFVRVVPKGADSALLREAVAEVSKTNLPQLVRHLQEEQRKYLWDHVANATHLDHGQSRPNELAFLLARRLANALDGKNIRSFFDKNYNNDQVAHAVEMYVWPPMGHGLAFGDIIKKIDEGREQYFVVLNPACDFAQCKAEKALLARCHLLIEMPELKAIAKHVLESGDHPSNATTSALRSLLKDNRQAKGVQAERYKFLPSTSFLPDLVVDYQDLLQVAVSHINGPGGFSRIATLDTPFAEAVQSRFVRYYGRVGTPDLEWDVLIADMINALPKKAQQN